MHADRKSTLVSKWNSGKAIGSHENNDFAGRFQSGETC